MDKGQYQLSLGIVLISIIGASLAISYFVVFKPNIQNNQTTTTTTHTIITTTTTTPSATSTTYTTTSTYSSTTTTIDNTQKCINAGGECKQNCDSATTDSVSSNFLQGIINWLLGSVFGSPPMQEIGSYAEYCTEQLPKCCKPITTTTSTSSSTTSTSSQSTTTTTIKPPVEFGVIQPGDGKKPDEDDYNIQFIKNLGAQWKFISVQWGDYQANPSLLDVVLQKYKNAGIKVSLEINSQPYCITPSQSVDKNGNELNNCDARKTTTEYTTWIKEVVTRYKQYGIKYWQVENHANAPRHFWLLCSAGSCSNDIQPGPPSEFVTNVLNPAYDAIKQVDPEAKVSFQLGSFPAVQSGYLDAINYLRGILQAGAKYDMLWVYAEDGVTESASRFDDATNLMNQYGGIKPIWTETCSWSGTNSNGKTQSQETQSQQLYEKVNFLISKKSPAIFWYKLKDSSSTDNVGDCNNLGGLLNSSLTPKLAYYKYQEIIRGSKTTTTTSIPTTTTVTGTTTTTISSSTTTITQPTTTTTTPPQGIYYRPFNLIYAKSGGKTITETGDQIIAALNSFSKKPTMITDVLLNEDPAPYDSFLNRLKAITPNLCFAMGDSAYALPTDYSKLMDRATKYRIYTTCVRLDHFSDLVDNTNNDNAIEQFLTDLHTMGFEHIIANPWHKASSGTPWSYVDAAQQAIDTSTWEADYTRISNILSKSPSLIIVANYENPTAQQALTALGAQGSIDKISIAADKQNTQNNPLYKYRWMPAWSKNYDPYQTQLGTLNWIANKLAEIDP
jgi:hypothetical protein